MEKVKKVITDTFSLRAGSASHAEIYAQVIDGARIKGANLSILIFAIFIASIGLNLNSTAVIIGAMLISPLMGGIISIGYGLATNDAYHAKDAITKFLLQIAVCILTSTIYFMLSPISVAGSELLARTHPTIWDVLIACFGGFAGVIGITRKEKTNVIPGVAIATALMPPLCTAGYGIAIGSWTYLGGAMYLFFINSFFICVTSVIVLKILRVPGKQFEDARAKKRSSLYISIIAIIVIIPSVFFGYQIANESVMNSNYQAYVRDEFDFEDTQVVQSQLLPESKTIEVTLVGKILSEEQITDIAAKLPEYNLAGMTLRVTQTTRDTGISKDDVQSIIDQKISTTITQAESELENLKATLASYQGLVLEYQADEIDVKGISGEIKALYPQVLDFAAGTLAMLEQDGTTNRDQLVAVLTVTQPLDAIQKQQMEDWLKVKTGKQKVFIYEMISPNENIPQTIPEASAPTETDAITSTVVQADGTSTTVVEIESVPSPAAQ